LKKKELVIIDLKDNHNTKLSNINYLKINTGDLIYDNKCKSIKFDLNIVFKKKKNKILKFFKDLLKKTNNFGFNTDAIEMEIFNLRHDKSSFIERILILEYLSKYFYSKKLKKKIITDDYNFADTIKKNFPGTSVILIENKSKKFSINLYLSIINYFIKLFLIITLFKFTNKNKAKKYNEYNLTIYPHFFENERCKIFKNSYPNLNILLGDETQSSFSLKKLIINAKKINNLGNTSPVEKNISYLTLVKVLIKNFKECFKMVKFLKNDFIYNNLDIVCILKKQFILSFLNRLKLDYYDNALDKLIDLNTTKKLNYYMFEYSFGFYLSKKFKNISKKIETIGYQHGIFTNNILWIELLNEENKKIYLPTKVVSNQNISKKAYSKYINKKNIYLNKTRSSESLIFSRLAKKNSTNILAILGLHDFKDNIQSLLYLSKKKKYKNCKFFLKFHPKTKNINFQNLPNNFKIISKIENNKKYQILISQSSSLLYKLMESKIECKQLNYNYKINIL